MRVWEGESRLTIEYSPAHESLGHTAPLDYAVTYPVLGIPIRFQSNSAAVIGHAAASFEQWAHLASEWVRDQLPCDLTVIVHPAQQTDGTMYKMTRRIHSNIYLGASNEMMFYTDNTRGQALAFVAPQAVENGIHFRYNLIESLAYSLATVRDRVAVHAGALTHNGITALLMGKSTVGKSTLSYAAFRTGDFDLVSEDVIFVQADPIPQIFGGMGRLHLLPDAPRHFPELANNPPQLQANGKIKIGVPLPPERVRLHATPNVLFLLHRDDANPSAAITPVGREEVLAHLMNPQESGYDLYENELPRVAAVLADCPAYRFTIGNDLEAAIALLKTVLTNSIVEASRP